jgi:hypothetical protein
MAAEKKCSHYKLLTAVKIDNVIFLNVQLYIFLYDILLWKTSYS